MITAHDLSAARRDWGNGLVSISNAYETDGIDAARQVANDVLEAAYGYDLGAVLFKPTLSGGDLTFRTTKEGALSYFVGHDPDYPQDAGFGLKGWRETRSETAAEFIDGDVAMWMGWILCINKDGKTTKVDKSFGYKKDADGVLRIVLHHSSLPYEPVPTEKVEREMALPNRDMKYDVSPKDVTAPHPPNMITRPARRDPAG